MKPANEALHQAVNCVMVLAEVVKFLRSSIIFEFATKNSLNLCFTLETYVRRQCVSISDSIV